MTREESGQNVSFRNDPYYEDEIELMDYLLIIWKWKWMIILITFVCMVTAGVVSFKMPRIHEISMIIEPAVLGMQENGNPIFMDLVHMKGKIDSGIYNSRILKRLNINPRVKQLEFKAVNLENTKLIKIHSEWEHDKILTGTKILAQLAAEMAYDAEKVLLSIKGDIDKQIEMKQNEIVNIETERKDLDKQIAVKLNEIAKIETERKDFDKQIEMKQNEIAITEMERKDIDKQIEMKQNEIAITEMERKDIDKQIALKLNEIAKIDMERKDFDKQILLKLSDIQGTKNQIKLQEAILKNIGERKTELIREVQQVKNNTESLIQQKNRVVEGKSNGENVSLLLYFTTVQQNVAYFNQLNDRINDLKSNEDRIRAEIEKFEKVINDINTSIERLKIQKTEGLQKKINDINTAIERLKIQKTEGFQTKINDINTEIEWLKIQKAEGLQTKINDIKIEIERLGRKKSYIENIKMLKEPEASEFPVKPRKKSQVALAGVVGFMLALFMAFFVEYLQKSRKETMIKKGLK